MQSNSVYESERFKKQNYLKKEIIESKFDPSDFENFVCNLKENGNILLLANYSRV